MVAERNLSRIIQKFVKYFFFSKIGRSTLIRSLKIRFIFEIRIFLKVLRFSAESQGSLSKNIFQSFQKSLKHTKKRSKIAIEWESGSGQYYKQVTL